MVNIMLFMLVGVQSLNPVLTGLLYLSHITHLVFQIPVPTRVNAKPFLIGCYPDVMRGKHLPHTSCKLTHFISLLGSVHLIRELSFLPGGGRLSVMAGHQFFDLKKILVPPLWPTEKKTGPTL